MKKNILIVDDSALMRRVISDIIKSDDRFQVMDTANNGMDAFDLIIKNTGKYDAILLDINMPKMSGLELLEQMNRHNIKHTTIMVSTLAKQGAAETIRALELGAFDFVTKPDSYMEVKSESFHDQILKRLCWAFNLEDNFVIERTKREPRFQKVVPPIASNNIIVSHDVKRGSKLIALACSTGGPKALQDVIPTLPKGLDAPMLLVQHMPAGFTKSLAMRLNEMSNVYVKEAQDGDILENGTVYIAKGGAQMKLEKANAGKYRIILTDEPARGGLKPCADIMYESLLASDFETITCVVLTGMGGDGTKGIMQLKEYKKIYVIAQDQATSTVYGMPKVVAEAGLTNEVLPLRMISGAITQNVGVR
ncbi:MAG: chemotaxis-specific protein-glutamate methyltransferase CheB [Velocimicrobium sp.]